jgi:hypothetical protein
VRSAGVAEIADRGLAVENYGGRGACIDARQAGFKNQIPRASALYATLAIA